MMDADRPSPLSMEELSALRRTPASPTMERLIATCDALHDRMIAAEREASNARRTVKHLRAMLRIQATVPGDALAVLRDARELARRAGDIDMLKRIEAIIPRIATDDNWTNVQ